MDERSTHGRAPFACIVFTVFLNTLAFSLMIPVLPRLIVQLEGGNLMRGATVSGVFDFTWAALQFSLSPFLGALSDRFGRRPFILLANLGSGVDCLAMALAPTLPWLFLGRLLSGVSAGGVPAANAYLADVTPVEQRPARFGTLTAAGSLAFVLGPALGGQLGAVHLRLPFAVAAVLSVANGIFALLVLPESLPPQRRAPARYRAGSLKDALSFIRCHHGLAPLVAATFLNDLALDSIPSVLVLYSYYRYGWSERRVGGVMGATAVAWLLVSVWLLPRVTRRLGDRRTLRLGLASGIAGFVVAGLAPTGGVFYVALPCLALWGLTEPMLQAMCMRPVRRDDHGRLQGIISSVGGMSGMIAPLVFSAILAAGFRAGDGGALSGAAFLLASMTVAGALLLAWRNANLSFPAAPSGSPPASDVRIATPPAR